MTFAPERAPRKRATASAPRWALFRRQFDLIRSDDGRVYLTRWWLVKTPRGGIALHRMMTGDTRTTVHDHPFAFLSVVLRGGYVERRLRPRTMNITEERVVRFVNRMRRDDAHSITRLLRTPTWTLLICGRHYRTWGFWEKRATGEPLRRLGGVHGSTNDGWARWWWTRHDEFDSGHYVPLDGEAR